MEKNSNNINIFKLMKKIYFLYIFNFIILFLSLKNLKIEIFTKTMNIISLIKKEYFIDKKNKN